MGGWGGEGRGKSEEPSPKSRHHWERKQNKEGKGSESYNIERKKRGKKNDEQMGSRQYRAHHPLSPKSQIFLHHDFISVIIIIIITSPPSREKKVEKETPHVHGFFSDVFLPPCHEKRS